MSNPYTAFPSIQIGNLFPNEIKPIPVIITHDIPTIHINNNNNKINKDLPSEAKDVIEKLIKQKNQNNRFIFDFFSKKQITKEELIKNKITLNDLINNNICITDLYLSGIIVNIDDFKQLGYIPGDLRINKKLFNLTHLKTIFKFSNDTILKDFLNGPDITSLLQSEMNVFDLQNIGFNFDMLFEIKNGELKPSMRYDHLIHLQLELKDAVDLGLRKEHLKALDIKPETLIKLKWNKDDVMKIL